jgi:hypothetical protein
MVAQTGNDDPGLPRRLQDRRPFFDFNFSSVYGQVDCHGFL